MNLGSRCPRRPDTIPRHKSGKAHMQIVCPQPAAPMTDRTATYFSRPRKEVRPDKTLRGSSRPFWSGRSGPRINLEFTRLLVTAFRLFALDDVLPSELDGLVT
jgi:hypothetical protein